MKPHICHRDLATTLRRTYEISSTTPHTLSSHTFYSLPAAPAIPAPALGLHGLAATKHPLCSGRGSSTSPHPRMGSPNRVLCPKQPHLRAAQPKAHTAAAAPPHDWTQAKETQCTGLAPSSLPLYCPAGCTQVTQLGFQPDHSWTASRTSLVNTQSGEAPVHSGAIARMVHVGFGLAQSGLKT